MLLKLMSSEKIPDNDPTKSFKLISNINEVQFHVNEITQERYIIVQYSVPNRDLISEQFMLSGNAYLMNDSGKTIQSFSYN